MLVLKVKWFRTEEGELVDETTIFELADRIEVHGLVKSPDEMKAWEPGSYFNYQLQIDKDKYKEARLIESIRGDKIVWYLASLAWILGPDGKTIERLN